MKAVVAAFNQEKALVGAFSVITNLRMEPEGDVPGLAQGQEPDRHQGQHSVPPRQQQRGIQTRLHGPEKVGMMW